MATMSEKLEQAWESFRAKNLIILAGQDQEFCKTLYYMAFTDGFRVCADMLSVNRQGGSGG